MMPGEKKKLTKKSVQILYMKCTLTQWSLTKIILCSSDTLRSEMTNKQNNETTKCQDVTYWQNLQHASTLAQHYVHFQ